RTEAEERRRLLSAAMFPLVFAALHHVEHVIRGTHVGWPVIAEVTPFTFSLVVYPILLLGMLLTARGAARAGYWLFVGVLGLGIVGWSHGPQSDEQVAGIYYFYADRIWGVVSVGILALTLIGLVNLLITALRIRASSGRW
ncbi:MAG TPA: hypothetical protein VIW92_09800, partial [Thermoanaerobaculia bacterium]